MKKVLLTIFIGFLAARFLVALPAFAQWIGPTGTPPNSMPTSPEFIQLGPAAPQVGMTANPSIHIQDLGAGTGGGGDLIRLEILGNAYPHFVVGNDGNTGIQRIPGFDFDVGDNGAGGDLNADRLCFAGDCRDDWISVINAGGGGTAGRIVKWDAGGQLADTIIYEVAMLIGVDQPSPAFQLDVGGDLNVTEFCIATDCRTTWGIADPMGSATDNVLPKWSSGGVYLTDTLSPVNDSGVGSVGFGAAPPGGPLDIGGDLRLSGAGTTTITGAEDDLLGIYQRSTAADSRSFIELWGGSGRVGELTLGGTDIAFRTNSTTAATGSQAMYLTSAGRLGIGVGAPGFQLDVLSQFNADKLCLDGDCIDSWADLLARVGAGSPHVLLKRDGGGATVTSTVGPFIDLAGNVGIGTSTPGFDLDINGDANATRWCIAGNCIPDWASAGTDSQNLYLNVSTPSGTATADSPTDTLVLAEAGGIDLRASGDTITIDIDSSVIQTRLSGGCVSGQGLQRIDEDGTFFCIPLGETIEDWIISGSNQYSAVSGNVGIGDTSPNAKLDVEGTARFDYPGGSTTISDTGVRVFDAEGSSGEVRLGAAWSRPGVYSSTNLNLLTSGGLALSGRGNTTDIYLTTSGRVGMGTTSPSNFIGWTSALQVNGEVRAARYYDDNSSFYVDSNATSIMNIIHASIVYDRDNTAYYSNPASTSYYNDMRANIYYDRNNTAYYMNPASTSYFNDMRANIYYDRNNTAYYMNPASGSRFNVITTAGNVGIGTTSATKRLDVRGTVRIDQGSSYDVWIQGGSCSTGNCRNLAMLGQKSGDQLRLNWGGEYTGGTRIDGSVWANAYYHLSDRSQKRNIQKLDSASTLKKILQLDAVSFNWADSGEEGLGFIAQDVEKLFPEIVVIDAGSGLKTVNYSVLAGPIVEAIQERQREIENMMSRAEVLEAKIQAKQAEIY